MKEEARISNLTIKVLQNPHSTSLFFGKEFRWQKRIEIPHLHQSLKMVMQAIADHINSIAIKIAADVTETIKPFMIVMKCKP